MTTKSVTLRIPDDILDKIPAERGERSRAIVDLLRKGLSLPSEEEVLKGLTAKIDVLEEQIKSQDQRIKALENIKVAKSKTEKPKEKIPKSKNEDMEEKERLKQMSISMNTTKETKNIKGISLEKAKEPSDKKQRMTSSELLKILRIQDPDKRWGSNDIARFRRKANADKWHTVGVCKFKYANEKDTSNKAGKAQYLFWVIYPFKGDS